MPLPGDAETEQLVGAMAARKQPPHGICTAPNRTVIAPGKDDHVGAAARFNNVSVILSADRIVGSPQFNGIGGAISKQINHLQAAEAQISGEAYAGSYSGIIEGSISLTGIEHEENGAGQLLIPLTPEAVSVVASSIENGARIHVRAPVLLEPGWTFFPGARADNQPFQ